MSKNATTAVWIVVIVAAGLWSYLNQRASLSVRFLPGAAFILAGMLLTDAMEVRRTGIAAMRHQSDIRRDADAAAFRTQLRVQYATTAIILGIGVAVQIAIMFS
ncbi:hypothetical protein [Beijerinckia sp. L45]|uniref:hypothetical protein n=1 Tax=Beijerinckia sp. L45 TaxID=1641855 RepID=UPI00131ECF94|nr:hypothetical protein [Beijerinckia sp. L45]